MSREITRITVLLFCALLASGCATGGTRTISYDEGGSVYGYLEEVDSTRLRGVQVRFTGECWSACTLYLGLPPRLMCVTPGASFMFHRNYSPDGSSFYSTERDMLEQYPEWVREWLRKRTGTNRLPVNFVKMDYEYARHFIRAC